MSPAALPSAAREATLDRLERERFDCVVIGGGITGAGVAREAASRGLSVALLEAEDFASGTSSRSSKLIHGGLRYLAMGDVALVRQSALERKVIHRLAPHLAEPRWLVVPTRSRLGAMKVRAGVTTYEKLGAVEGADLHRNWSAREMEQEEPALDRSQYKHAVVYREYLADDARLVLANLRDAAGQGAAVLNHARVEEILDEQGRAAGVEAACRESGRRVHVRARCVINAAGPWVEAVRRLEDPDAPAFLHLSKGVHLVFDAERVPVRNMLLCNTRDKRSIFVIPRGSAVYVGTTDTSFPAGAQVWPGVTTEDVEYLLEPLARYLTIRPPEPDDVRATWSGLRPLIAQPGKKPEEISRRDEVLLGPLGVVTIAGGKLTGYRPMARETVEKAAAECDLPLAPVPDEDAPLPGGDFDGDLDALAADLLRRTAVGERVAARLVRLYGSEAAEVARRGAEPLAPGSEVVAGEVGWAIDMEAAARVEDVLYRRTRAALYDLAAREAVVEPIAAQMAERLGWDAARRAAEVDRARALLAADLTFRDA